MSMTTCAPLASSKMRRLFLQKGEYSTCHILINDTRERLAGIEFKGQLYSFFKTIKDREKALDVMGKLYDSGNDGIITETPKTYAIWILEKNASSLKKKK